MFDSLLKKIIATLVALAALIFCIYLYREKHQLPKVLHSTRFPETRTVLDADLWSSMDHSERSSFLKGYMAGYQWGRKSGCVDAEAIVHKRKEDHGEADLWPECFGKGSRFGNSLAYYEKAVTDFYSQYPGDRDIPLSVLLDKLSDSEHMTLEQIHAW